MGGSYQGGGGGGHGGEGGDSLGGAGSGGAVYGRVKSPTELGSGGAEGFAGWGGDGGGAVKLVVASNLVVDGTISARGVDAPVSGGRGGGGSGGSLWLECADLQGNGTITADGGRYETQFGGGGAGGRIAAVLTGSASDFSGYTGCMTAHGRIGQNAGAAGTVYRKPGSGNGGVLVDNDALGTTAATRLPADIGGVATELEDSSLTATNLANIALSTNAWVGDILVYTNCTLTLDSYDLYVDSLEHDLGDAAVRTPGNTNRVDHYEQIIWVGLPKGTLFILR